LAAAGATVAGVAAGEGEGAVAAGCWLQAVSSAQLPATSGSQLRLAWRMPATRVFIGADVVLFILSHLLHCFIQLQ